MINIITKTKCPNCDALKSLCKALGVEYTETNAEEHPEVVQQLKALGATSVPQVYDGEQYVGDFNAARKYIMENLR